MSKETPLMQQYASIKRKYPGAILLFRVGDFYETFGEDAIKTAAILGIVLTKRSNGSASEIELAGFPHHAKDVYLPKLVKAGQKVAICDQLEDPKLTKTIVKRGVTELITPGVLLNDNFLDQKSNNFLAVVFKSNEHFGIAMVDASTGEFWASQGNAKHLVKLMDAYRPSETIIGKSQQKEIQSLLQDRFYTTFIDDWIFTFDNAQELLFKHFNVSTIKGFGIENMPLGVIAAGVVIHYLNHANHHHLPHIRSLARNDDSDFVWIDNFSIRNLEIIQPNSPGGKALIDIIDFTVNPLGARMLKNWLVFPLKKREAIEARNNIVNIFFENLNVASDLQNILKQIGDLERLIAKVATQRINPREFGQLRKSLAAISDLKAILEPISTDSALEPILDQLNPCISLYNKLIEQLVAEPPIAFNKGDVICEGIHQDLDEFRNIARNGKEYLIQIQQREIANTGITSLKIGFNSVFGYFLEVTNAHKNKVPIQWSRKQTLVNAERYITDELKDYELKITQAESNSQILEESIYKKLVEFASDFIEQLQLNAKLIAQIDILVALAQLAKEYNYVKPNLTDLPILELKNARHPVIEKVLPHGTYYVPNDISLDSSKQQIIIITGPNMAGKSAILRQTALITILAQIGSFVPAESAIIGVADKIFSRVGASDNISAGESTFMVEMNETASILNNISNNSLVLLDEIGRGTSTYDGISIAWSIVEFLHEHPQANPRTLFATHYHELNQLEGQFARVKNYHVAIKELEHKIVFLRKLSKGAVEHSFGIHVARMAGMPNVLLNKAEDYLQQLENLHGKKSKKVYLKQTQPTYQMDLFALNDPNLIKIKELLLNCDINTLTPIDALFKLNQIKQLFDRIKPES